MCWRSLSDFGNLGFERQSCTSIVGADNLPSTLWRKRIHPLQLANKQVFINRSAHIPLNGGLPLSTSSNSVSKISIRVSQLWFQVTFMHVNCMSWSFESRLSRKRVHPLKFANKQVLINRSGHIPLNCGQSTSLLFSIYFNHFAELVLLHRQGHRINPSNR